MNNYNLSNLGLSRKCVPFFYGSNGLGGQLVVSVDFFKVLFGTLWSWFYLGKTEKPFVKHCCSRPKVTY